MRFFDDLTAPIRRELNADWLDSTRFAKVVTDRKQSVAWARDCVQRLHSKKRQ
jgi:hypothetical protein